MERNEPLYSRWIQDIWSRICKVDDIVDIATVNRARPEDIEEAKRLLSEFTGKAAVFLDQLNVYVRSHSSEQRSSSGS